MGEYRQFKRWTDENCLFSDSGKHNDIKFNMNDDKKLALLGYCQTLPEPIVSFIGRN